MGRSLRASDRNLIFVPFMFSTVQAFMDLPDELPRRVYGIGRVPLDQPVTNAALCLLRCKAAWEQGHPPAEFFAGASTAREPLSVFAAGSGVPRARLHCHWSARTLCTARCAQHALYSMPTTQPKLPLTPTPAHPTVPAARSEASRKAGVWYFDCMLSLLEGKAPEEVQAARAAPAVQVGCRLRAASSHRCWHLRWRLGLHLAALCRQLPLAFTSAGRCFCIGSHSDCLWGAIACNAGTACTANPAGPLG